ncbi:MAG: TIGR03758 family integrating conjugative element protein [Gammaproteobacteria bacterium]|jgi:integrating conjugative element protein (TIGR03758 family)|nr:MAG: TIGR03758 family integrating conjugative element protein [Gammaproteobacteria bacterium]
MSLSADQVTAFQANAGYSPDTMATVLISAVFAVLLLWGVWALRTAYVGWAEHSINQRQFLAVAIRFVAMYVMLTFLLLS